MGVMADTTNYNGDVLEYSWVYHIIMKNPRKHSHSVTSVSPWYSHYVPIIPPL